MKALILFLSWLLVVTPVSADSFPAQQLAPVLQVVTGHYNKGPVGATPTVTQKTATACTSATSCSSSSITSVTGRTMVVLCFAGGTTSITLSASDSTNTYNAVGSANNTQATINDSARAFVATNITGVAHVLTCTGGASATWAMFVYEMSGGSTTAPVDVPTSGQSSGNGGASSATPSFTLPATTFAHDLLVFAVFCANTCSADGSADVGNSQADGFGNESETYAKTATGTYTGQFSQTAGAFNIIGVAITAGN